MHLHHGVSNILEVDVAEASATLIDPLEEIESADEPEPEPAPEPQPKPAPAPASTPDTGDALGRIVAPIGAALGGLGALMAAYSARRVQNERGGGGTCADGFGGTEE